MPGKRALENRSNLHPFEKELPERHPGMFCHKGTSGYIVISIVKKEKYIL
jgi:hypothetical protein